MTIKDPSDLEKIYARFKKFQTLFLANPLKINKISHSCFWAELKQSEKPIVETKALSLSQKFSLYNIIDEIFGIHLNRPQTEFLLEQILDLLEAYMQ